MPRDFLIGAGIVLAGRTAFEAAVGGSIRQIDSLGKEIEQLNARAKRIRAVQALTSAMPAAKGGKADRQGQQAEGRLLYRREEAPAKD